MFGIDGLEVIFLLIPLAGIATLFWLAITAIRAMNVYIARNRIDDHRKAPTVSR